MTDRGDIGRLRDSGEILDADFLSIDIEALLRKLPGSSFRSPHHYPVELVRAALLRGAARVEVEIDRSRVVVSDDGGALDETSLERLVGVFDPGKPAHLRQEALAFFESERGITLLAAFTPSPEEVVIETGTGEGRKRVVFRRGRTPRTRALEGGKGTSVAITRAEGSPARERETVAEYCRYARASVVLDGKLVSGTAAHEKGLVSTALPGWSRIGEILLWIPVEGDMCRVRMLDHGIRWDQKVYASKRGLVYEAAVECAGELPDDFTERAGKAALGLYQDLVRQYDASPRKIRDRIQELLFLHYRQRRDASLLEGLPLFPVHGDGRVLSFDEVQRKASDGIVYAMRSDDDPDRYQTRSSTVLVLTPGQWEFLAEHAGVPLAAPVPVPAADPWHVRLLRRIRTAARDTADRMRLGLLRPLGKDDLDEEEGLLVDEVSSQLEQGRFLLPGIPAGARVEVIMSDRGRSLPGRVLRHEGRLVLALFRRHPLTRKAALALKNDPANILMVLPLLTGGHDGWQPPDSLHAG